MWRALPRFDCDWVAQPTIRQEPAAATARLRHFGIGSLPYQPKPPRASENLQKFPRTQAADSRFALRGWISLADVNNAHHNITTWPFGLTHSCNADNVSP